MKILEKKKLVNYRNNLLNNLPDDYLKNHEPELNMIDWLIGFYEGRTASSPKEYLESLIRTSLTFDYIGYYHQMIDKNITPLSEIDMLKSFQRDINFLYNWIYYKKITGF